MHVPDGVIPLWLQLLMFVVSGAVLVFSAKKVNKQLDERLVPYMGVLAAVIFAAQFVNFPIPPSSGHLVGSTLLAVLVGPWAAIMIISMVLFVQALMGDGGILTYGLNFFNMGALSCPTGWLLAFILFRVFRTHFNERKAIVISAAIASYVTIVLAATVLGLELFSVTGFGFTAFAAIVGIHALIGVGEAIITSAILLYFVEAHPQMIFMLSAAQTSRTAEPSVLIQPRNQM